MAMFKGIFLTDPVSIIVTAVGIAGVLNAFLMAAILARQYFRGMSRAGGALALILALIGIVFGIIIVEHAGLVSWHWALQAVEMGLALGIAPLVLYYVCRALDLNAPPLWTYGPLIAFIVYAVIEREHMFAQLGYGHIVILQLIYLCYATFLLYRWRGRKERNAGELESARYVGYTLFFMFIIHMAETLRTIFPESPYLRDVVPLIGAVSVLILTFVALGESRVFVRIGAEQRKRSEQSDIAFEALEQLVQGEKLYLQAGLSLDDLAARTGIGARKLSLMIREFSGKSFIGYINHYRLEHARKMLRSGEEKQTSVEAIGLLSGFGSRSSFYSAFKKTYKQSPAEYRGG